MSIKEEMEKPAKQYIKQIKMQHELNKFGHDVPAGKMWTDEDMKRYFTRKK